MRAILLVMCAVLFCLDLFAETSKKEYQKSFDKNGIGEVVVSNRYGQIEVQQTEGDKIEVAASLSLIAKSQSKADELMGYINVKDVVTGTYINIETDFGKDMTFQQLLAGVEVNISYKISLPKGIKLRLINTDGNVFIDDFNGDLNVDVRNGNFKGGKIEGEDFYVKQDKGTFQVNTVDVMNGEFKACTVRIENGGEVKLVMNDCEGRLESIDKLNVRTSGGTMKFGQVEDLSGSSSSTKYEIQDVGDMLRMDMKMGEINIRNIHFNFSTVEIKGSFTKVGLTFMEDAGYNLDLKHNKSLKMDLPKSMKLGQQPTSEKNMVVETGFVGNTKYKGKVFLDLKNGNLYIQ